jgi:hypothetical protein
MSDIFVPAIPKSAGAQAADLPPRNDPIPQGPQKRKRRTAEQIAADKQMADYVVGPELTQHKRRGKQADPPAVAALKVCARTLRDLNDTDAKSVLALLRAVFE